MFGDLLQADYNKPMTKHKPPYVIRAHEGLCRERGSLLRSHHVECTKYLAEIYNQTMPSLLSIHIEIVSEETSEII